MEEPLPGLRTHPRPARYPFGPVSIADILSPGLDAHPERLALIDDERSWTWAELDSAVAVVAAGITQREAIAWDVGNCAAAVIGALATFRAGGIWVGASSPADRARIEAFIGPVRVISSPDEMPSGTRTPPVVDQRVDPHEIAAVNFTSGTSGRPKAVAHSQHNLLWPGLVSIEVEPPATGERIGTPLSLGIGTILALGPFSSLVRGSTFVVMSRTHASGFAADVERHDVTRAFVVATMLYDLVKNTDVTPAQLGTLDRIIVGGSPAAPELLTSFHDRFSIRPTLSYGMSEAPSGVVREAFDDPIGSGRGFALPHVEVTIRNREICIAPVTTGRWANTWTGTLGYLGEPDRTNALFDGGVMHTGDLGTIDGDGAVSVTGRISSLIVRGGKNIDPTAVVAALLDHPSVADAHVVGVPDGRLGQIVGAVVVAAPGETIDIDALGTAAETDVILVRDDLPRTSLGKVAAIDPTVFVEHGATDLA